LPPLAITGGWFIRHRNTALGIAAAGTGCGTLVLPPVAAALIQQYGWRVTNVIFGVVAGLFCSDAPSRSPRRQ
jgi:MFS family permease